MAQSLGTVTKLEDGRYEGALSMLTLKTRITIVPNETKSMSGQPDYRVFADGGSEIGGGWMRTGKASGRDYISLTFAHPAIGPKKLYANLGRASGTEDGEVFAILWNPDR